MKIQEKTYPQEDIQINADENVRLSILIGEAQIGGSQVKFSGDTEIIKKGKVLDLPIGTGEILTGKILEIITNVFDINPGTNNISVTHFFTGAAKADFLREDVVKNNGDVSSITSTYQFI